MTANFDVRAEELAAAQESEQALRLAVDDGSEPLPRPSLQSSLEALLFADRDAVRQMLAELLQSHDVPNSWRNVIFHVGGVEASDPTSVIAVRSSQNSFSADSPAVLGLPLRNGGGEGTGPVALSAKDAQVVIMNALEVRPIGEDVVVLVCRPSSNLGKEPPVLEWWATDGNCDYNGHVAFERGDDLVRGALQAVVPHGATRRIVAVVSG
jgi:hypothetical protein